MTITTRRCLEGRAVLAGLETLCRLRNPKFTGRTEALRGLRERLAAGPVAVVALRGLAGVGKSQLALEYAHRNAPVWTVPSGGVGASGFGGDCR